MIKYPKKHRVGGVYELIHRPSGKYYIGQAKDFGARITRHRAIWNNMAKGIFSIRQRWMVRLFEEYGFIPFDEAFDGELLYEIEDLAERNKCETETIRYYKEHYPDKVLNSHIAGTGKPKLKKSTRYNIRSSAVHRSAVFVYDIENASAELFLSLTSAADDIDSDVYHINAALRETHALKKRFLVESISADKRAIKLRRYMKSQRKTLRKMIASNHNDSIIVNNTANAVKYLYYRIAFELYIKKYFNELEGAVNGQLDDIIAEANEMLLEFIRYVIVFRSGPLASRYNICEELINRFGFETILLYDIETQSFVAEFSSPEKLLSHIKLSHKRPNRRTNMPRPLNGEYFAYYKDADTRYIANDRARRLYRNYLTVMKRRDRLDLFGYLRGSYQLDKLQGISRLEIEDRKHPGN